MHYYLKIDETDCRLYCRASGIWDGELADRFLRDMIRVREWGLRSPAPISVLSDLTGLSVHSQDISPIIGEGARQLEGVRYERYAMIVPSSLMRMQVRRLDPWSNRRFFDDVESAIAWLGWHGVLPGLGMQPA